MTKGHCTTLVIFNPLSGNPIEWPNTFKQVVGNLPMSFLSVFDHSVKLALKGLREARVL